MSDIDSSSEHSTIDRNVPKSQGRRNFFRDSARFLGGVALGVSGLAGGKAVVDETIRQSDMEAAMAEITDPESLLKDFIKKYPGTTAREILSESSQRGEQSVGLITAVKGSSLSMSVYDEQRGSYVSLEYDGQKEGWYFGRSVNPPEVKLKGLNPKAFAQVVTDFVTTTGYGIAHLPGIKVERDQFGWPVSLEHNEEGLRVVGMPELLASREDVKEEIDRKSAPAGVILARDLKSFVAHPVLISRIGRRVPVTVGSQVKHYQDDPTIAVEALVPLEFVK